MSMETVKTSCADFKSKLELCVEHEGNNKFDG